MPFKTREKSDVVLFSMVKSFTVIFPPIVMSGAVREMDFDSPEISPETLISEAVKAVVPASSVMFPV